MSAVRRDHLALLLRNRAEGAEVERWVATNLLARIHEHVRIVGGLHGGAVLESNAYDIDGDALPYEVKKCNERIRRSNAAAGTQPGRWKIDTWNHHGLDPRLARHAMYVLVVCDDRGPKHAYLVSHAKMTTILSRYARQGRYVSLSTSVWVPRLVRIYQRPPRRKPLHG